MRKVAFSVWPDLLNNPIPDRLNQVRNHTTVGVLEAAGFEVTVRKELDPTDPIIANMLPHNNGSIRYYTKVADYIRLKFIQEYLDAGYDEILYFDYDMVIFEAPTSFGCAIECHLQQDVDDGPYAKLWNKGVNSCYYIGQQHRDAFNEHFQLIKDEIVRSGHNPQFCYPMDLLYPIEEKIGYIKDYWHFGSFSEPKFCTPQKVHESMILWYYITGDMPNGISACNMMGTRDLTDLNKSIEEIKNLGDSFKNIDATDPNVLDSIMAKFAEKVRIRPNYNSHVMRAKIRKFLDKYHKPKV